MKRLRILSVIGTRPEALKMGPVLQTFSAHPGIESIVCTTGQHRELLTSPLKLFELRPAFDLALMKRNQSPADLSAAMIGRLGKVVVKCDPDWIVAVGDTTSVMVASLVAAYHKVRFGHIEAGLRSGSKWDPFPEEFYRRVTTVLADLHFAPTPRARDNLLRENVPRRAIVLTGNPIIDTLKQVQAAPSSLSSAFIKRMGWSGPGWQPPRKLIVATFHRRENIGRPTVEICAALRELASLYQGEIDILCIVHPNPLVREPAQRALSRKPGIILSPPLDYPTMVAVLQRATVVLTDSGGLQEEAPYLRVPVLVLRNVTERPEGLQEGVAKIVGTEKATIVAETRRLLDKPKAWEAMRKAFSAYGDGRASARIVKAILKYSG